MRSAADARMLRTSACAPPNSRTAAVCALLMVLSGSAAAQDCAVPADACTGQLSSQVVIITGASRGVGAEMARVYGREGASVVVNYFASKDKAEAVVAEINSAGPGRAIAVYGDVTSAADMQELVAAAVREFGGVHALVSNALASYRFDPSAAAAGIKSVEWAHMQAQMEGTVRGALNAVQAAVPHFEAQGSGKILMIGARPPQTLPQPFRSAHPSYPHTVTDRRPFQLPFSPERPGS